MRLRAAIAAAVVLGLGGALAPGHAEDTAPVVTAATPAADPGLPQFQPSDDAAKLVPDSDADTASDDGDWQPVGKGIASWYGRGFAGHRTASGERFDPSELTAAHRTLPFGTRVRVTDAAGDSVVVRINDRGPYARGRVIDLSRAAARKLGITRAGSGRVTLSVLADGADDSDQ